MVWWLLGGSRKRRADIDDDVGQQQHEGGKSSKAAAASSPAASRRKQQQQEGEGEEAEDVSPSDIARLAEQLAMAGHPEDVGKQYRWLFEVRPVLRCVCCSWEALGAFLAAVLAMQCTMLICGPSVVGPVSCTHDAWVPIAERPVGHMGPCARPLLRSIASPSPSGKVAPAVPAGPDRPSATPTYCHVWAKSGFPSAPNGVHTCYELWRSAVERYGRQRCLVGLIFQLSQMFQR